MASRKRAQDGDHFRVRPAAPTSRAGPGSQRFVSQVLKAVSKAGAQASGVKGARSASTFGRGRVAAGMAGGRLGANARRVVIKTRFVVLKKAGARAVAAHLRYIERDGTTRDGQRGQAYGAGIDTADLQAFEERGRGDRHQFRFIVSVEDASELEDLRGYTRELMARMEVDLETRLDWVAVDHWDTDNPHTHVVLRGKVGQGRDARDLVIAPDYLAHGMRLRASELATEWLGPRTELEIQQALRHEVEQERWTSLDRTLQRESVEGRVQLGHFNEPGLQRQRLQLIGRLQCLQRMGLADEVRAGTWTIHADAEKTLRSLGERGDIVRTMQRAMSGQQRELSVFEPGEGSRIVTGRVAAKGLGGELHDRGYLVIDGTDGKAHYVALHARDELAVYPTGTVVEVRGSAEVRGVDRNIVALASDGLYRTDQHLAIARRQAKVDRGPQEIVEAHVRRLQALRRAGIVDRVAEGLWKVPRDLPEKGRNYDAQRLGGVTVELKSHLPIERQAHVLGATWLDQQLIGGRKELGDLGFGGEVKNALQQRADFLAEQGLAERRGQRVILARNLLATLRNRELAQVTQDIVAETGLRHWPVADGQRVSGIYRRSVLLVSGRYAMLDSEKGFCLVPWKPVIEQRLGQQLAATVRNSGVSWDLGRQRGA